VGISQQLHLAPMLAAAAIQVCSGAKKVAVQKKKSSSRKPASGKAMTPAEKRKGTTF
jgi:hypothetical protein